MEEIEVIAECYVLSNIKIGEFAIKKIIFLFAYSYDCTGLLRLISTQSILD